MSSEDLNLMFANVAARAEEIFKKYLRLFYIDSWLSDILVTEAERMTSLKPISLLTFKVLNRQARNQADR